MRVWLKLHRDVLFIAALLAASIVGIAALIDPLTDALVDSASAYVSCREAGDAPDVCAARTIGEP